MAFCQWKVSEFRRSFGEEEKKLDDDDNDVNEDYIITQLLLQ